ncbi:hypothetical protein P0F65_14005 [Sphingomonas sp. I4]
MTPAIWLRPARRRMAAIAVLAVTPALLVVASVAWRLIGPLAAFLAALWVQRSWDGSRSAARPG